MQAGRYVVASSVGGIPDIHFGRPEIGDLVEPGDPVKIADALDRAISRIEHDVVDPAKIRAHYNAEFRGAVAHRQWLAALGLEHLQPDAFPTGSSAAEDQPRAEPTVLDELNQ